MLLRALIVLLLGATAADAGYDPRRSWYGWERYDHSVWAKACDRVTGRCVWARRYFRNPVWQRI